MEQQNSNYGRDQNIINQPGTVIINTSGLDSVSVPNIHGLSYGEARKRLIEAGWQPLTKHWSYINDANIQTGNGSVFWEQGYQEIHSCSGTGYGFCSFEFVDVYSNKLKVITAGMEDPARDIKATVVRWYFDREDLAS
ncbi:PASTA domain-containing protein [Pseudanabaenaceae cyanobacterium LEGE 13415]|nr:PASTA domain-containing protein [Pseudanabaenaceae cyanobacterium LEGE 13415]